MNSHAEATKEILIGTISTTHGIKGGFTFNLFSKNETVLATGMTIFLKKENQNKSFQLSDISIGNKIIAYLDGIQNIEQAEKWIGSEIYLERSSYPQLKSTTEYYWVDLIGLEVTDGKNIIGKIESLYENGMQSVFVIKCIDGSKLDIPYIDSFVKKIDLKNKIMEIVRPEYLE